MELAIKPYADDAASMSVGGLTLENGTDRIAVYGNLDLTRDGKGLTLAKQLKAVMDEAVRILETGPLPDAVPPPEKPGKVKNPFA